MGEPNSDLDCWEWHDDSFKLDFLNISNGSSRPFWEEVTQLEDDAITMFDSTPVMDIEKKTSPVSWIDALGNQDSFRDITIQLPPNESSIVCNKRRRMLLFSEPAVDSGILFTETSFGAFLENLSIPQVLTSASYWKRSSCEDGYAALGGALPQCSETTCIRTPESMPSAKDAVFQGNAAKTTKEEGPSLNTSLAEGNVNKISRKRSLKICVAYPFALLKPSKIEGDVTLKDINQRILLPSCKSNGDDDGKCSGRSGRVALVGKSVVSLTKIHTQGNGSVTIIRTKC